MNHSLKNGGDLDGYGFGTLVSLSIPRRNPQDVVALLTTSMLEFNSHDRGKFSRNFVLTTQSHKSIFR